MTYFDYLKDIIGIPADNEDYDVLLSCLFLKKFEVCDFYPVANDYNRIEDGIALQREYYFEKCKINRGYFNFEGCSVLEVLVALARRIENDFMYDPEEGDRTGLWMRVMLDNLGISQYQGSLSPEAIAEIEKRCDIMMKRMYDYNGRGGLFPLENPEEDQRKVQIWDQVRAYLRENYL